jgi:hypothetical protein
MNFNVKPIPNTRQDKIASALSLDEKNHIQTAIAQLHQVTVNVDSDQYDKMVWFYNNLLEKAYRNKYLATYILLNLNLEKLPFNGSYKLLQILVKHQLLTNEDLCAEENIQAILHYIGEIYSSSPNNQLALPKLDINTVVCLMEVKSFQKAVIKHADLLKAVYINCQPLLTQPDLLLDIFFVAPDVVSAIAKDNYLARRFIKHIKKALKRSPKKTKRLLLDNVNPAFAKQLLEDKVIIAALKNSPQESLTAMVDNMTVSARYRSIIAERLVDGLTATKLTLIVKGISNQNVVAMSTEQVVLFSLLLEIKEVKSSLLNFLLSQDDYFLRIFNTYLLQAFDSEDDINFELIVSKTFKQYYGFKDEYCDRVHQLMGKAYLQCKDKWLSNRLLQLQQTPQRIYSEVGKLLQQIVCGILVDDDELLTLAGRTYPQIALRPEHLGSCHKEGRVVQEFFNQGSLLNLKNRFKHLFKSLDNHSFRSVLQQTIIKLMQEFSISFADLENKLERIKNIGILAVRIHARDAGLSIYRLQKMYNNNQPNSHTKAAAKLMQKFNLTVGDLSATVSARDIELFDAYNFLRFKCGQTVYGKVNEASNCQALVSMLNAVDEVINDLQAQASNQLFGG